MDTIYGLPPATFHLVAAIVLPICGFVIGWLMRGSWEQDKEIKKEKSQ